MDFFVYEGKTAEQLADKLVYSAVMRLIGIRKPGDRISSVYG